MHFRSPICPKHTLCTDNKCKIDGTRSTCWSTTVTVAARTAPDPPTHRRAATEHGFTTTTRATPRKPSNPRAQPAQRPTKSVDQEVCVRFQRVPDQNLLITAPGTGQPGHRTRSGNRTRSGSGRGSATERGVNVCGTYGRVVIACEVPSWCYPAHVRGFGGARPAQGSSLTARSGPGSPEPPPR
ncbi:hypothetical protein GCM10009541_48920 [Micromonospora gifhornensis]